MPSISRTPNGSWRVQYYLDGKKLSKTFKDRQSARAFVSTTEMTAQEKANRLTFADLLSLYQHTESLKKRGAAKETVRINALLRKPIATHLLASLTTEVLQNYAEERLRQASPTGGTIGAATVRREFSIIHAVLSFAVKKKLIASNPAVGIELPQAPPHRERIASEEDIEKLLVCCSWDGESVPGNLEQLTILMFLLSCRTGMRAGEMLQLERSWIRGNVIRLPKEATKTFARREVALCPEAKRLIKLAEQYEVRYGKNRELVFASLSSASRDALFRKVRDRAGLGVAKDSKGRLIEEGLNFHDGRATFATWAASPDPKTGAPRLDVLALARQTGHRNLKMLQRYYRASAEDIAKRLGS